MSKLAKGDGDDSRQMLSFWRWLWSHSGWLFLFGCIVPLWYPLLWNNYKRKWMRKMPEDVKCPKCGSAMVVRTAKKGPDSGFEFYVCTHYPECKGKVPL